MGKYKKKVNFKLEKFFPKNILKKNGSEEFITTMYNVFAKLVPVYQAAMSSIVRD